MNSHLEKLTELHTAIVQPDMARVRQLVEQSPLLVRVLVRARDENGRTPLHFAAIECNAAAARFLLHCGADVDARDRRGRTPLFVAIYEEPLALGRTPFVDFLIERGAEVSARDMVGDTPLHTAALGETEIVALLLERGADVNARNDAGETPLHKAVQYPERAIVSHLLRYGGRKDIRSAEGRNPAQIAEERGWTDLVALLSASPMMVTA